jgi:hypothetical protein
MLSGALERRLPDEHRRVVSGQPNPFRQDRFGVHDKKGFESPSDGLML